MSPREIDAIRQALATGEPWGHLVPPGATVCLAGSYTRARYPGMEPATTIDVSMDYLLLRDLHAERIAKLQEASRRTRLAADRQNKQAEDDQS